MAAPEFTRWVAPFGVWLADGSGPSFMIFGVAEDHDSNPLKWDCLA